MLESLRASVVAPFEKPEQDRCEPRVRGRLARRDQ